VGAVQSTVGTGKTSIAAAVIARWILDGRLGTPVGFAVPTHRLGEELAEQFRKHGITAEVWRGREAFISGKSGEKMCKDLAVVEIAKDMGAVIETACCKGKDPAGKEVKCIFYDGPGGCEYQAQKKKEPDVWIFPHQMLFRENKTLDGMSVIFIDESFRDAGTSKPVRGLTFDEIEAVPPHSGELGMLRSNLARALRTQPKNGGVPRANLVAELGSGDCTQAIKLEWAQKEKQATLWPGMPAKARAAAAKAGSTTWHIRTFDRVWRAARELIELTDPDVVSGRRASGRLFLANHKTENGVVRVVRTRGIRPIAKQYLVPVFIMDATLPSKAILEKWFPDIEVVANIEVPMPYATTKQILGAPVAAKKLAKARNLKAVHRYILREWVREGRGTAVVIMQKEPEAALKALGLPPEIATEHYNGFTGVDIHKDVRLLIEVGRTLPGPDAVEEDAGALSGVEPVMATSRPNRPRWYGDVIRGIRMRDGTTVAVTCDLHPDSLAEDVRWQICEGGLVQGVGRARGVNRTAENPVTHHILNDIVLPLTIDVAAGWDWPELEVYMVAEGIWLESPADMAAAWPDVWPTPMAANNWLRANTVYFPFIDYSSKEKLHRVRYHRAGPKRKWRTAWVDPAVVPDPRGWLEARLGPLSGYELVTICFTLKADSYIHHGLDFATPPLTVRPWSSPLVDEVLGIVNRVLDERDARVAAQDELAAIRARIAANDPLEDHAQVMADLRTLALRLPGARPGKFPWPTPKALEPFVTRVEMEAFWALPPVVR
jgi:hypothetical protein